MARILYDQQDCAEAEKCIEDALKWLKRFKNTKSLRLLMRKDGLMSWGYRQRDTLVLATIQRTKIIEHDISVMYCADLMDVIRKFNEKLSSKQRKKGVI